MPFALHLSLPIFIALSFSLVSCDRNNPNITNNSGNQKQSTEGKSGYGSFPSVKESNIQDTHDIEANNHAAAKCYAAKDFDNAIFHFTKVLSMDEKNLFALINLGNVYFDSHQCGKAIEYYKKAIAIDTTNTNVRCDMATCYLDLNMPEVSIGILKENIKINFNHSQSHHNLSVIYTKIGKHKEAAEEMGIYTSLTTGKN